ncbi:PH domain-containing protein [Leucobacter rhizosphaerae]|uniref:PH domain-containing protein n=1 Tax=Leucobacter rhizosphaerae TaxID=2932245 RepID=A0ABY4FUU5_9MICO|nr:PH domain-containing protein [Leucobacter rhizosphaerae]UOQ60081.1 PH domain-containing protein [Leucobacter rhizosphaerae]
MTTPAPEHVDPQDPWPNGVTPWQRVSPKYAWADLVLNLLFVLLVCAALVIVIVTTAPHTPLAPLIAMPAVIVILIINALLAFRRVRAIGYILREDDFLFRRGIMFERVIAVPYGRLQLVDVNRGPLLRSLGLSTLKFVTASAATGVQLPGLPAEDAEALRDRLVELAETRRSGL